MSPRVLRFVLITTSLWLGLAAPAHAQPDDAAVRAEQELNELSATLKAAVLSGSLSEEDGMEIYYAIAERLEAALAPKPRTKKKPSRRTPQYAASKLTAPFPEQIEILFVPEFRTRDLAILRDELDLDRDQLVIVEALLGDYTTAFELACAPLREASIRHERAAKDRWLADALGCAQIKDVDVAVANIRAELDRRTAEADAHRRKHSPAEAREDRAPRSTWSQRMLEAAENMDERLSSLRERVQGELDALEREEGRVTGRDLLRLGRQLRQERAQLRAEVTSALAVIVTEAQAGDDRARLHFALARIRILHLLPHWRLGGESTDVWDAFAEAVPPASAPTEDERAARAAVEAILHDAAISNAAVLDARTEATLDREIAGLVFRAATGAAEDGPALPTPAEALTAFADASRRELDASIVVRNRLLALLDRCEQRLMEDSAPTERTQAFRDAAHRHGFPPEMRRRWAERATDVALRRDDLAEEQREAIVWLATKNDAALRALRVEVIEQRLDRDPRRARKLIGIQLGGVDERIKFPKDYWRGLGYERFAAIDERTDDQLRTVLTPEQLEDLPKLRRAVRTKPARPRPSPRTSP